MKKAPQTIETINTLGELVRGSATASVALSAPLRRLLAVGRHAAIDPAVLSRDIRRASRTLRGILDGPAPPDLEETVERLASDASFLERCRRIRWAHRDLTRRPRQRPALDDLARIKTALLDARTRAAAGWGGVGARRELSASRTVGPVYAARFALALIADVPVSFLRDRGRQKLGHS